MQDIQVELLRDGAVFSRETEGSVGYDVCYCPTTEETKSFAHSSKVTGKELKPCILLRHGVPRMVPLGAALILPDGVEAQIRPRSSTGLRLGLSIQFGTVDTDFRGELHAIVMPIKEDCVLDAGVRIAQVVFNQVLLPSHLPVSARVRGTSGFGSTGVKTPPTLFGGTRRV